MSILKSLDIVVLPKTSRKYVPIKINWEAAKNNLINLSIPTSSWYSLFQIILRFLTLL
jgi:hypothetical protein